MTTPAWSFPVGIGARKERWLKLNWTWLKALGAQPEVLGIGSMGIVLAMRDPTLVLKVTKSQSEATAVQYVQDLRTDMGCAAGACDACLSGLPFVNSIWHIPDTVRTDAGEDYTYAIVREGILDLHTELSDNDELRRAWWQLFGVRDAIADLYKAATYDADEINWIAKRAPQLAGPARRALADRMANALAEMYPLAPVLADTLDTLWTTYGIVLDDLHEGNIGIGQANLCRPPDEFVFFDYMNYNLRAPKFHVYQNPRRIAPRMEDVRIPVLKNPPNLFRRVMDFAFWEDEVYENPRKRKGMQVQTVMFHWDYWTVPQAKAWLKSRGYSPVLKKELTHRSVGMRETANYYRFRQQDTSKYVKGSFRTIKFGADTGIKAIVGRPK